MAQRLNLDLSAIYGHFIISEFQKEIALPWSRATLVNTLKTTYALLRNHVVIHVKRLLGMMVLRITGVLTSIRVRINPHCNPS